MKFLIISLLILSLGKSFAQESQKYLELNQLISAKTDEQDENRPDSIGYLYTAPQYEENQDPDKAVIVEYYFGEFDGSEESIKSLEFIQELIEDDRKTIENYNPEVLAITTHGSKANESDRVKKIIQTLKLSKSQKKYEEVPESIFFNPDTYQKDASVNLKKKRDRIPAGFSPGRNFWTFARFSAGFAPTFAALTIVEGLAPGIAASVAFWPGAASGAITYFNGAYGNFVTSGSWAKWLLNSDKKFAQILRKGMGLNPINFEKHLLKNKEFLSKANPTLFKNNPELFEQKVRKITQDAVNTRANKITNIAKKLMIADEYVKWFATEVAFTSLAVKIPQAVAGIGAASTGFIGAAGDVLMGSAMGMLAQGPGDIAIQKRKLQKIDELFEGVKSGKIQVENKAQLLDDIKKFKDPNIKFTIGKNSHKALRRIENWARSRATMLSFFSVAGVGMELAGIPLGRPILLSVGIGGGFYYGVVEGWINKSKIKSLFSGNFITKLKKTNLFSISGLIHRVCASKFTYKHANY